MALALHSSSGASRPRRVFIAVPAYGQVSCITTLALFRAHTALLDADWGVELHILQGECHIDDARNTLARDFLKSDCTDLLFVDADVGFDVQDILRLLSHHRDVVGGAYPKKQDGHPDYPVRLLPGDIWADADGLIEVEAIATGFLRIQRAVLEDLAALAQQYVVAGQTDGPVPLIFERAIVDGARWSGDNNFCRKWREQGGKVYADPQCFLEHEGSKIWAGTLATHLRRKNGLALGQIERIKAGTETDRDYIDLVLEWDNDPWNAGVELVKACVLAARKRPGAILEAGSGLTTLVMAAANPTGTVHCLEHSPVWAARVAEEARRLGLFNIVIHCEPLREVNGRKWYDTTGLPGADWSLVLNDGPPRQEGDRSVLWETLGPTLNGAMILVDDVEDERQFAPARAFAEATGREVQVLGQIRKFALVRTRKEHA